ncbi:MAG: hypothetical protein V1847_03380, partial [Candidatus Diapherotrites archaeon]
MKNALYAIAALLLVVGTAMAAVTITGLQFENFSYNPAPAVPGQTIDVYVNVKNASSSTAQNVGFEVDLYNTDRTSTYPFSLPQGETGKKDLGNLQPGQSVLVKFALIVDPSASNADYTIHLKTGENGVLTRSTPETISIVSRNPKIELIQSSSSEIRPGQTLPVELTLKNTGSSTAYNILVGVKSDKTVTATGVIVETPIKA